MQRPPRVAKPLSDLCEGGPGRQATHDREILGIQHLDQTTLRMHRNAFRSVQESVHRILLDKVRDQVPSDDARGSRV